MNFDYIQQTSNHFYKNCSQRNIALFGTDKVKPYWIADMDFTIADEITEELNKIIQRGMYCYENQPDDFYEVMSNWFNSHHQLQLNPNHFCYVPGVLTGISFLVNEFTQKGDAVLVQTPVYHQFMRIINNNERQVISASLTKSTDGFSIDFEALEKQLIENNVKLMIFCNPHNPVGRVWTYEEVAQVVALCEKHQVYLLSDEIHSEITFGNHQFQSITQFSYDKIIAILGSPGKTFGLQSIASGFLYIKNDSLRNHIQKRIEALCLDHSNAFTKYATYAAYSHGEKWLNAMKAYVYENYQWIQSFLSTHLPLVQLAKLEGTYVIWLDFSAYGFDKQTLENIIFKEAGIGFAPGDWFGKEGIGCMRMTIATPRQNIIEIFETLHKTLEK